jgi:chitinase
VKRVNSGSTTAYTDGAGNTWAADKVFSAGTWGYSGGSVASTTSAIANTTDDPLYQEYRLWSSTANPAYRFTVPNGTYSVKLLFMEPTYTAANKRKFDIRIEGTTRTAAYDIYAAAGARYKAISKTYTVNVTDGLLEIALIRLSGFDNPLVCGVQVRQQ